MATTAWGFADVCTVALDSVAAAGSTPIKVVVLRTARAVIVAFCSGRLDDPVDWGSDADALPVPEGPSSGSTTHEGLKAV